MLYKNKNKKYFPEIFHIETHLLHHSPFQLILPWDNSNIKQN